MGSAELQLLDTAITLEDAMEEDDNILHTSTYPQQRLDFYIYLIENKVELRAIVSHHLRLPSLECCEITNAVEWVHGSFNICIPVLIHSSKSLPERILMRFPLPYKVGEYISPGNADEKLRSEAATYIWLQENCPTVPIPYLWAFGFSNGESFTAPENRSLYARLYHYVKQHVYYLLGRRIPCRYIAHPRRSVLTTGYLLIEFVEEGKMLSYSWDDFQDSKVHRQNLFSDISRIMLEMGRISMPRIGSFTIGDDGIVHLMNRLLTLRLQMLENERIPTHIERNTTYTTTGSYLLDLLQCHDYRLSHQPNAVHNEPDCLSQMAVLTVMRALLPQFFDRSARRGPFLFTLTDLHQSNIFVDNEWHITKIIDLEWACSLPQEMQHPPYWMTGRGVDQLRDDDLSDFQARYAEFMDAFEAEEQQLFADKKLHTSRTHIMRTGLHTGKFWYHHALHSTRGLCNIFFQHIGPMFSADPRSDPDFNRLSSYYNLDTNKFVARKLQEKKDYLVGLHDAFRHIESSG